MNFLLQVLSNAFEQIVCIFLLMVFFIYTFTIIGMSLFKDTLPDDLYRYTFNSFEHSFQIVFAVFTLAGWENILYSLLEQSAPIYLIYPFLLVWIFIGNYVFLNLFLAILLDNFESEFRRDKKQISTHILIARDVIAESEKSGRSRQQSARSGKSSL